MPYVTSTLAEKVLPFIPLDFAASPMDITAVADRDGQPPALQRLVAAIEDSEKPDALANFSICLICFRQFDLLNPRYDRIQACMDLLCKAQIEAQNMGLLECVKQEIYRRVGWYEEGKRSTNGDFAELVRGASSGAGI